MLVPTHSGKVNLDAAAIDGYQQVPDERQRLLSATSRTNEIGDVVLNVLRLRR
jgi:hypothetical protein